MKFTPQILDDIRARVSITSVVGRRVQWDRQKSNPSKGDMWACCPFHAEKTPSFHVDERKGRYYCFGCHASGDVIRFLTEKDGLSLPEAVEQLAHEAGIQLVQPTPQEVEREKQRLNLYEIMALAAEFFASNLSSVVGRHALDYLHGRGLTDKTIATFGLGVAVNSRFALKEHLASRGVSEAEMVLAGLVVENEDGGPSYDRFRNRVVFPIHDSKGKLIAFGGRALEAGAPAKYLNSPDTPLFSKGKVLFNLHRARQAAFQLSRAIVVEGYLDVIMLHQAGIENVVAPLGTAMTDEQLQLLWKVVPTPFLCFDGDDAGYRAANRAFDKAFVKLSANHDVRVAFMPKGQDPADLVAAGKLSTFIASMDAAMTASDFFWWRATQMAKIDTPEEKSALERSLNAQINDIEDPLVRKHYALQTRMKLSNLFYQHDRTVLRKKKGTPVSKLPSLPEAQGESIAELERSILSLAVHFPDYFQETSPLFSIELSVPAYASLQADLREGRPETIAKMKADPRFAESPLASLDAPDRILKAVFDLYSTLLERARVDKDVQDALASLASKWSDRDYDRIVNLKKLWTELSGLAANQRHMLMQLSGEFAAWEADLRGNRDVA